MNGQSFNWLDLTVAQSYHVGGGADPCEGIYARRVAVPGHLTQPLQPATVDVQGEKCPMWLRAVIGNTAPEFLRPPGQTEALGKTSRLVRSCRR